MAGLIEPGMRVRHPDRPEWGTGQVQSVVGDRITVNFEHAGKRTIDTTHVALEAADLLAKDGISAEVIDLRTLRPIDYDTVLASVQKTNRCVTVEEGFPVGSIGDHLASTIMQRAFDYLDAPLKRVCAKDVPLPYAASLEALALPQAEHIVDAAKEVCYR